MTIYVDDVMIPASVPNGSRMVTSRWCHLMSDQLDPSELHRFARRIGLRRTWFQHKPDDPVHDHYDVTLSRRAAAIRAGAVQIDAYGLGELLRRRRAAVRVLESEPDLFK